MTVQARLAQRSRDAHARARAAAAWEGVNDARQGRVRIVAAPVAPPASAPRRGEFVRAAVPPPRTKWTCRVPPPVLIGHAASLTP